MIINKPALLFLNNLFNSIAAKPAIEGIEGGEERKTGSGERGASDAQCCRL